MRAILIYGLVLLAGPAVAQLAYPEVTAAAGLPDLSAEALAVGDYDNDGWPDVYASNPRGPNQLLRNNADGTFTDVAPALGLTLGADYATSAAAWIDYDNDGYDDLYVACRERPDLLYRNRGDGTFADVTAAAGLGQYGTPQAIVVADFDNDGWPDLYVANFGRANVCYRNNGDGTFTDRSLTAGAYDTGASMGALAFDYEQDGDADLLLIRDSYDPTLLYRNDGTGVFTEVAAAAGINTQSFGMGADVGDLNRDGFSDVYITNLYGNYLLLGEAGGTFRNVSGPAGTDDPGMGWGVTFLDADNDGWEDLYVANEHGFSPFPNVLYRNQGNEAFATVLTDAAVCNRFNTLAAVALDYDQDGREDLLVANRRTAERCQLFRNASAPAGFVQFALRGTTSNRRGVGATLSVRTADSTLYYREVTAGSGWKSQKGPFLHFGLGAGAGAVVVEVRWPGGAVQTYGPLVGQARYTLVEGGTALAGFVTDAPLMTALDADPASATAPRLRVAPVPFGGERLRIELADGRAGDVLTVTDPLGRTSYRQRIGRAGPVALDLGRAELGVGKSGLYVVRLQRGNGSTARLLPCFFR